MAEHVCLTDKITQLRETLAKSKEDGTTSLAEMLALGGVALELIGHTMQCVGDHESYLQLAAEVQELYREFIKPIDIPGVPNWIEPTVDGLIISNIPTALESIHNLLHEH